MDSQRQALIVATNEYDDEGLTQLAAPAVDAAALAGVLGDPAIGGFTVRVLSNEPAHVIQERIEELFADSHRDGVVLLHFSCHGLKSESGELYFAARNTRPNRLSTAVPAEFVQRCMRSSRCRSIVLLLDCCYGGAFSRGVKARGGAQVDVLENFPSEQMRHGHGRAVITASSSMEYAFEGEDLADNLTPQPSIFTSALVHGLATGDADLDADGWVSLDDLYEYVFERVQEHNPHQTPTRDIEVQGDLYLARSPRRQVKPRPLPADLEAAIANPNMFTRLGAVNELRARLHSDNPSVAVAAHAALVQVAETDIQHVADLARGALADATLTIDPPIVDFGQIEQNTRVVPCAVHLTGPPIARHYGIEPPATWIHVTQSLGGITVTIDSANVGVFHDPITLTGPTQVATIPVFADVIMRQTRPPATTRTPDAVYSATTTRAPKPPTAPTAHPPPPAPAQPKPRRLSRRGGRVVAAAAAVTVAGIVAGVVYAMTQSQPPENLALHRLPVHAKKSVSNDGRWNPNFLTDGQLISTVQRRGYSASDVNGLATPDENQWVDIDLGSNQRLGSVRLYPRTAVEEDGEDHQQYDGAGFPIDFTIETSADRQDWHSVRTETHQSAPDGKPRTYKLDNGANGRYVRLDVTHLSGPTPAGYNLQLVELEVYKP
jgi:hypothetical protein